MIRNTSGEHLLIIDGLESYYLIDEIIKTSFNSIKAVVYQHCEEPSIINLIDVASADFEIIPIENGLKSAFMTNAFIMCYTMEDISTDSKMVTASIDIRFNEMFRATR